MGTQFWIATLGLAAAASLVPAAPPKKNQGGQGRVGDRFFGRFELKDIEKPIEGVARFRSGKIEFLVKGRRRVLKAKDIDAFTELAEITEGTDPKELEKSYQNRLEAVSDDDAHSWIRLGIWCRDHGLAKKSKAAFEKAVALDPELPDARRELGFIRLDGAWALISEEDERRRGGLEKAKLGDRLRYAEWAAEHRLPGARPVLDAILAKDPFHKKGLRLMERFTKDYRLKTKIRLPFDGRWKALPDRTNHHQKKAFAVYALDLVKVNRKGKAYSKGGKKLKDYYTYGASVYAVAAGTVVEVRDRYADIPINSDGGQPGKHNGVSIRHENGEHSFYVHLKRGSISVEVGDRVDAGERIGRVGNSGATTKPHLHFTMAVPTASSVPWVCRDFRIVYGGSEIRCREGRPREGQILIHRWPGARSDPDEDDE